MAYARVLMDCLRAVDPAVTQYVFLADNVDGYFNPADESFQVVLPEDFVEPSDLNQMAFQYTAFELSTALKAYAHRYMLRKTCCDDWMYFDSDIYPISSCKALLERPNNGDATIFLTPHILKACPPDLIWLETLFLHYGIYNGGWLGIRRSADAEVFIEWYVLRLRTHSFSEYRFSFTDQLWLNLAPLYLHGFSVVDDPGANIGYWNLHERNMTETPDGSNEVDGTTVSFVHFSGWDATNPMTVTRYYPQIESSPAWRKFAAAYSKDLLSAGLLTTRTWPYSWACYENGQVIGAQDRRKFADQSYDGSWPATLDPFKCPDRFSEPTLKGLKKQLKGRLAGMRKRFTSGQ